MKRTVVTLLVVSLFALPLFAQDRVEKARCVSLEHARGAWQMQISCERGEGSISLADSSGSYTGNGVFSTWSQPELRALYQSLLPSDAESFELMQLG